MDPPRQLTILSGIRFAEDLRFIYESSAADIRIVLRDASGRIVHIMDEGSLPSDPVRFTMDARSLPPGLYLLDLTVEGTRVVDRLVKQ